MPLRPLEIARVSAACARALDGARVRGVREDRAQPDHLTLALRTPGDNHHVVFNLDGGFLYTRPQQVPAPSAPAPFTMFLRKHLVGCRLVHVDCAPDARTIRFDFEGKERRWLLHIELLPQQSNLYLCDIENTLVQCARPQLLAPRELSLGERYIPPTPWTRHSPEPLPPDWPDDDDALWPWLRTYCEDTYQQSRAQKAQRDLQKRLKTARKRAKKRVRNVYQDLQRAEDATALREEADLLQSVRHRVQRGQTSVEVPDWNTTDMRPRTIELRADQSIEAAISRRYARYRRLKDAETLILRRLEQVEAQQQRVEDAWARCQDGHTLEDFESLRHALERAGIIRRIDHASRVRARARKPYREARSSDGYRILIGRSAKDNDTLSLHIARGRDLWLHARDVAGSHVIVWRKDRHPIPDRTMHEAALLAAQYSSAKDETAVDVGYTERKHISKAHGAPAGSVHAAGMRTLLVSPNTARCRELLERAARHARDSDTAD